MVASRCPYRFCRAALIRRSTSLGVRYSRRRRWAWRYSLRQNCPTFSSWHGPLRCVACHRTRALAHTQLSQEGSDTVGEITTRRQKPLVLRIMVEEGRTRILFLSGLTPRCEQIFPRRCCFQPVRRIRQQIGRTQGVHHHRKETDVVS